MKTSKKLSATSIRVLETLKILSNKSASIQDIINYFEKFDPNNRIYTNEVILKYINTLKVFGFKFTKEKDKYVLLNTMNQFELDENDLKAVCALEKFASEFPEEKIKDETNKFLQDLEKRFNDTTKLRSQSISKSNSIKFELNYAKYTKQIKIYEKYCRDKQRLKITYKRPNMAEISVMVEPNEIRYKDAKVYLNVYNSLSAEFQDINFDSILKIEQLPLRSNYTTMPSSVTFQLKDRLAKSYRLHEGEKLVQINTNGNIIVLSRQEDRYLLLRRLMRYGENCEIISPKNIREEMYELIKSTLNNYN